MTHLNLSRKSKANKIPLHLHAILTPFLPSTITQDFQALGPSRPFENQVLRAFQPGDFQ